MRYNRYFVILIIFVATACNKQEDDRPRPHCGVIIETHSQNTSLEEGNPCGNNSDFSRRFALIVRNNITGNDRIYCVNISEYINYSPDPDSPLDNIYCDPNSIESW